MRTLLNVSFSLLRTGWGFGTGLWSNRAGSTATEYALIATLIAVTIIGSVILLGGNIENLFSSTANAL